jgi:hypothetical protein
VHPKKPTVSRREVPAPRAFLKNPRADRSVQAAVRQTSFSRPREVPHGCDEPPMNIGEPSRPNAHGCQLCRVRRDSRGDFVHGPDERIVAFTINDYTHACNCQDYRHNLHIRHRHRHRDRGRHTYRRDDLHTCMHAHIDNYILTNTCIYIVKFTGGQRVTGLMYDWDLP